MFRILCFAVLASLLGCGASPPPATQTQEAPAVIEPAAAPTPTRTPAGPVLIRDATLLTAEADSETIERGWLRMRGGLIVALGAGDAPLPAEDETVVEGRDLFVTPGLIDTHSHIGVAPVPVTQANGDSNEATRPLTPGVRTVEAFWPGDPTIERAVAGGVTTIQILPGSRNVIGGRGVVLKLHPANDTEDMRFPGAKDSLKMACGENPKVTYGRRRGEMPLTRMGSLYLMRQAFLEAADYAPTDGFRDLDLETLAQVLRGEVLVHVHCYRADEMMVQLRLAEEFGYEIRSFHHATEAYKIRDILAAEGVSISTWVDWWGAKLEAHDAIPENLAFFEQAGGIAVLHTDSREGVQRMNQEAAKGYYAGIHAGIDIDPNKALRWVTYNAAWALGVQDQTGTLTAGKMADVVVWDQHPFSVYARAQQVYIDGHLRFDAEAEARPWSDFEVDH